MHILLKKMGSYERRRIKDDDDDDDFFVNNAALKNFFFKTASTPECKKHVLVSKTYSTETYEKGIEH